MRLLLRLLWGDFVVPTFARKGQFHFHTLVLGLGGFVSDLNCCGFSCSSCCSSVLLLLLLLLLLVQLLLDTPLELLVLQVAGIVLRVLTEDGCLVSRELLGGGLLLLLVLALEGWRSGRMTGGTGCWLLLLLLLLLQ